MGTAIADGSARLVRWSGLAVIALHLAYAAATIAGFLSLGAADEPIADPWFAMMEWLIILIGPPVLVFLTGLGSLGVEGRVWSLVAVALAAMTFALSAGLHAVLLVIGRDHALVAVGGLLSFTWPSAAYAIDILAWDGFFALALLSSAIALRTVAGMAPARVIFLLAGICALAGLAGPISGIMQLRLVGVLGYAVLFPVASGLVLRALPGSRIAQKS